MTRTTRVHLKHRRHPHLLYPRKPHHATEKCCSQHGVHESAQQLPADAQRLFILQFAALSTPMKMVKTTNGIPTTNSAITYNNASIQSDEHTQNVFKHTTGRPQPLKKNKQHRQHEKQRVRRCRSRGRVRWLSVCAASTRSRVNDTRRHEFILPHSPASRPTHEPSTVLLPYTIHTRV